MGVRSATTARRDIPERVTPLARRVAERLGCELISVRYVSEHGDWVLRIVIDRDGSVSVEDCAKVSRRVSALLDVEDFIGDAYTLEVSSPGLEDELLVTADFRRYAGRDVRIQTRSGNDGGAVLRGKLKGLKGGRVILEDPAGARIELQRSDIAEARLEVEI